MAMLRFQKCRGFLFNERLLARRLTKGQMRQLFLVNAIPFIGFGFLDNVIMIIAGEYIDQVSS